MDRIDLAERRYKEIMPEPSEDAARRQGRRLRVWLRNDVCPLVADFAKRPRFREQATWPLQVFMPGANTKERRLIEAIDRGLVACAKTLDKLAQKKLVALELANAMPLTNRVTGLIFPQGRGKKQKPEIQRGLIDVLAFERGRIQNVAQRPWVDLVCCNDYLDPYSGWNLKPADCSQRLQAGDFIVQFNLELPPLGDFVTRAMLYRVEGLWKQLESFQRKCLNAIRRTGQKYSSLMDPFRQTWTQLQADVRALQAACIEAFSTDGPESYIILTQIYGVCHPKPDFAWLGLPKKAITIGTKKLKIRFEDYGRRYEMMNRIAAAVGDLRKLYEGGLPNQTAIDDAIAGGGLVLIKEPRAVYWNGKLVKREWNRYRRPWDLLWALATKRPKGASVTDIDVYDDAVSRSTMSTTLGRLRRLLPGTLCKRIVPGEKPRSYCLQLESRCINVFEQG